MLNMSNLCPFCASWSPFVLVWLVCNLVLVLVWTDWFIRTGHFHCFECLSKEIRIKSSKNPLCIKFKHQEAVKAWLFTERSPVLLKSWFKCSFHLIGRANHWIYKVQALYIFLTDHGHGVPIVSLLRTLILTY